MSNERIKCEKCGGRCALVSGNWSYYPDSEPYESLKKEESVIKRGDECVCGYICDDCEHIQDIWVEK